MPLIGRPMLSTMLASRSGGMIARIFCSTWSVSARRLLDAGPGRRAHMDFDRAGVDRGEEILAEKRREAERQQGDSRGSRRRTRSDVAAPVAASPDSLAATARNDARTHAGSGRKSRRGGGSADSPPRRVRMLVAQQEMRHRRHERVGEDVGGDHREHDRHRQRPEQIAGDAAEREQRHEGDADAEQRDRRRRHDLVRAAGDRGQNVLAVLLHVAVDVLDRDGRVVDEDADRQREAAERHHVDGLAEQRKARSASSAPRAGSTP